MRADEIARRLDNRAGYELLTYREVGLPFFGLHSTALVQEKQDRSCIEEFALRSLSSGLESAAQIQGILGLPERIVMNAVADLVRQEAVRTLDNGERLVLTERGRELLDGGSIVRPLEQTLWFPFDGLLRKPKWPGTTPLLRRQDALEEGLLLIRPIPARPPDMDDLSVPDVSEVVRLVAGAKRGERSVLKIVSIEKRYQRYLPAVLLVYRAYHGDEVQVGFAIDGRASHEHELVFARAGGVERQGILELIEDHSRPAVDGPLADRVAHLVEKAGELRKDAERITSSRSAADKAAVERVRATGDAERANAAESETKAQSDLADAEKQLRQAPARPVPVYEHQGILEDALDTARNRLLILSPWIRRAVVNDVFVKKVARACTRGVTVSIGFGLGAHDDGERPWDVQACRDLEKLVSTYASKFQLRRLGNTHAKVLIKDADFFVITSFNWLSFRGDPSQPFREEWGTMVRDPGLVNDFYAEMVKKFTP